MSGRRFSNRTLKNQHKSKVLEEENRNFDYSRTKNDVSSLDVSKYANRNIFDFSIMLKITRDQKFTKQANPATAHNLKRAKSRISAGRMQFHY